MSIRLAFSSAAPSHCSAGTAPAYSYSAGIIAPRGASANLLLQSKIISHERQARLLQTTGASIDQLQKMFEHCHVHEEILNIAGVTDLSTATEYILNTKKVQHSQAHAGLTDMQLESW